MTSFTSKFYKSSSATATTPSLSTAAIATPTTGPDLLRPPNEDRRSVSNSLKKIYYNIIGLSCEKAT